MQGAKEGTLTEYEDGPPHQLTREAGLVCATVAMRRRVAAAQIEIPQQRRMQ